MKIESFCRNCLLLLPVAKKEYRPAVNLGCREGTIDGSCMHVYISAKCFVPE